MPICPAACVSSGTVVGNVFAVKLNIKLQYSTAAGGIKNGIGEVKLIVSRFLNRYAVNGIQPSVSVGNIGVTSVISHREQY